MEPTHDLRHQTDVSSSCRDDALTSPSSPTSFHVSFYLKWHFILEGSLVVFCESIRCSCTKVRHVNQISFAVGENSWHHGAWGWWSGLSGCPLLDSALPFVGCQIQKLRMKSHQMLFSSLSVGPAASQWDAKMQRQVMTRHLQNIISNRSNWCTQGWGVL